MGFTFDTVIKPSFHFTVHLLLRIPANRGFEWYSYTRYL